MATQLTGVITKARRISLAKITSGAISSIPAITHIALGDGGVDEAGKPITPSETQTALKHEVGRYAIGGVTYPVPTSARYTVTVPEADLVGAKISEMALVDSAGALMAIKAMTIKTKDGDMEMTFDFDDEY